jgi:hypothetical protein
MIPENRVLQFVLQVAISGAGCILFRAVGLLLLSVAGSNDPRERPGYADQFYPLFHGITFSVALYAVIRAQLHSIHILVLLGYAVWLAAGPGEPEGVGKPGGAGGRGKPGRLPVFARGGEMLLGCLLFVLAFHLLPDAAEKQNDSFFYLKMAESLNSTGQENLHAYNNLFDPSFHGVEPYHYAEIWLDALLLRGTRYFLPGIETFRYVGYTILSVCVLYGVWLMYEVFAGRRAGWWARLFGLSFLFFLPDMFGYVPFIGQYLLYNFGNSYFERINFRTVYLYLIPLLLSLRKGKWNVESALYFVCLSVASYLCFLALVPAALILMLMGLVWPQKGVTGKSLLQMGALAMGVAALFGLFYGLFSNKVIGRFYQSSFPEMLAYLRRRPFYVLTAILGTLGYIIGIILLYTGVGWIKRREQAVAFCRENRGLIVGGGVMVITGVVMARVLSYQDNAYQLAFLAHILAAFFIFIFWSYISPAVPSGFSRIAVIGMLLAGCVLFKLRQGKDARVDIFRAGSSRYGGRHYTGQYIDQVTGYAKGRKDLLGGYLGDSVYYRQLKYFGERNPNVYFPPMTYIIAGRGAANYEFCLSDTAAILTGINAGDAYERNYLGNAIRRSGFYIYGQKTGLHGREALRKFITDRHLQYLILSGQGCEAEVADMPVAQRFTDPATGEIFLVLKAEPR